MFSCLSFPRVRSYLLFGIFLTQLSAASPVLAQRIDPGSAQEGRQIAQERQEALSRARCCKCVKEGDNGFCTPLTQITSCGEFRQHPNFIELPQATKEAFTNYTCSEVELAACEALTANPTPEGQNPATPVTPTTPNTPANAICPRTFPGISEMVTELFPQTLVSNAGASDTQAFVSITPQLGVPIPGLVFSPATKEGEGVVVPFLAQYIAAVYRYSIGLALIAAVIMVVYGGFRYLLGASVQDISAGKQIIVDAIIGLILALSAYTILSLVNPNTLELPDIRLTYIEKEQLIGNGAGNNLPIMSGRLPRCRCAPIPPQVNPSRILKVPCYFQNDGEWGRTHYGLNLVPTEQLAAFTASCNRLRVEEGANMTALPTCERGQNRPNNRSCIATIGQDGCGATSLATVLAYYNAQVDGHTVTPLDAARFAVLTCNRPHNGGTGVSHIVEDGDANSNAFKRAFPDFVSGSVRGAANVKALLDQGHPLIWACQGCTAMDRTGNIRSGLFPGGHFMVLTGSSEDGQMFSVHDVGGGVVIGIPSSYFNDHSARYVRPRNGGAQAQYERCSAASTRAASIANGTGSTRQGVAFRTFTYCPGGESGCTATNIGWPTNQAWVMIPERLLTQSSPAVRLFIYIHGHNSSRDVSHRNGVPFDNHVQIMQQALQASNPAKNIVIAGPHWLGGPDTDPPFMQGFDPAEFYQRAVEQLQRAIPGATVRDVSFGGHSAATCASSRPLIRTLSASIPNKYGYVIYDGCMGDVMTRSNFAPTGHPLLINPDVGLHGMGGDHNRVQRTNSSWGLQPFGGPGNPSCPATVPTSNPATQCYKHPTEAWWSFVTPNGHGPSVLPMTGIAFRALYGD